MEELLGYLGDIPGDMLGGPVSPSRWESVLGVGCLFGELGISGMCDEGDSDSMG